MHLYVSKNPLPAAAAAAGDLDVGSVDDAHPVGPDLGRGAIGQVVEVGADASPAEHVRQLLGGTGEAAVSAHLVERVAVGLLVIAVRHQVALTHAPPLKYTRAPTADLACRISRLECCPWSKIEVRPTALPWTLRYRLVLLTEALFTAVTVT